MIYIRVKCHFPHQNLTVRLSVQLDPDDVLCYIFKNNGLLCFFVFKNIYISNFFHREFVSVLLVCKIPPAANVYTRKERRLLK